MTAIEAFETLLKDKIYLSTLDISQRDIIRSYAKRLKKNRNTKLDTVLERHGYEKVKEPVWTKKRIKR